jgi:protein-tyrosine-phosphatase
VCHANVARSPAACFLLTGAQDERGLEVELRGAGTHATDGQPVSMRTRAALALALGRPADLSGYRAHQLGPDDVAWADLVIAMEASQVRALRRGHPDAAPRLATLSVLATLLPADPRPLVDRLAALQLAERVPTDDEDVEDPAGGDDEAYAASMRVLVAHCASLRDRLAG